MTISRVDLQRSRIDITLKEEKKELDTVNYLSGDQVNYESTSEKSVYERVVISSQQDAIDVQSVEEVDGLSSLMDSFMPYNTARVDNKIAKIINEAKDAMLGKLGECPENLLTIYKKKWLYCVLS